jgi:hypothetical protein
MPLHGRQRGAASRESRLLDLIGDIYEAALAPQDLPVVLSRLMALCGGLWAPMGVVLLNRGNTVGFQNAGGDRDHLDMFSRKYTTAESNPSISLMLASRSGDILDRSRYFGDAAWERLPMYQEVYRPIGANASVGMVVLKSPDCFVPLGMLRPRGHGAFAAEDLTLIGRVLPHLKRMMQIIVRLGDVETRAAADAALWDRLPFGVVVLDATGLILWANAPADVLFLNGEGLVARGGFLLAGEASANAALQRLVGKAALTGTGRGFDAGGVLAVRRGPGQRRPLAVLVAPFQIDRADQFALVRRPAVVVFVSDPERAPRTPPEHLAELYGLTPRESALVALLLDGCDLREAAGRLSA